MTDNLKEKFHYYGRDEYVTPDKYFVGGIYHPEKLDTLDRITESDKTAQRIMQAAKQLITDMQSYRDELYTRYAEMRAAQIVYDIHIQILRHTDYYAKKVYFTVCVFKGYRKGGVPFEKIINERYDGRERHKAIARYKELQREYPQAIAKNNITK